MLSDSGNFSPDWVSAVVLPLPGAPMNMYHGSWYKPPLAPVLVFFRIAMASCMRLLIAARSAALSLAPAGSTGARASSPATLFINLALAMRALMARQAK